MPRRGSTSPCSRCAAACCRSCRFCWRACWRSPTSPGSAPGCRHFCDEAMNAGDYLVDLLLSAMLIIGVYQFYFWCQRNPLVAPRELGALLDERIPYWPAWVWIYSGVYYPTILYLNL